MRNGIGTDLQTPKLDIEKKTLLLSIFDFFSAFYCKFFLQTSTKIYIYDI